MAKTKSEPGVAEFLATLVHPQKAEIELLREIILSADRSISDGIKWNSPSYKTTEWFATTNLREKKGTAVILHFGAKKRDIKPRDQIADPEGMLKWLADDRAMVAFADVADLRAKRKTFTKVIQQWIGHV